MPNYFEQAVALEKESLPEYIPGENMKTGRVDPSTGAVDPNVFTGLPDGMIWLHDLAGRQNVPAFMTLPMRAFLVGADDLVKTGKNVEGDLFAIEPLVLRQNANTIEQRLQQSFKNTVSPFDGIEGGLVYAASPNALSVYVGPYEPLGWTGGNLAIDSGDIPANANEYVWIVVYFTGVYGAAPDYVVTSPVVRPNKDDVPIADAFAAVLPDGATRLAGVTLRNGQTTINYTDSRFESLRDYLNREDAGTGGVAVSDGTTDVDPATLLSFDPDYFDVTDGGGEEALVTFVGEAEDIPYDNTASGLAATDVQAAIDEVAQSAFAHPLTTTGDLLTVSDTPVENADQSGIDDLGSGATETVIGDCDLTLIVATGGIDIGINVWWSMNQPSVPKNVTLRLRRDSVSGAVLASNAQGATIDSSAGHDRQWSTTYNDNTPTTGRYVLTFQRTAGGVNVISDTREFSLTAQSPNPARLAVGNAGQVLKSDGTVPEWGATAEYSTANVTNPPTDAELDSTFGTPATVGAGFLGVVNDNNGGTNEYLCWSDGANWFYTTGTKAT